MQKDLLSCCAPNKFMRVSVWLGVYFTVYAYQILFMKYHIVPKFSDARKHCCNLPKIQTKRPNLRVFPQKDANGIANSEDPGVV